MSDRDPGSPSILDAGAGRAAIWEGDIGDVGDGDAIAPKATMQGTIITEYLGGSTGVG